MRARRLLPLLLVCALALTGCGGNGKPSTKASASPSPSAELPTGNVDVPSGITLTKAGTQLAFGAPAYVAYQPNTQRSTVLKLQVDTVQKGRISDFAGYQLDAQTKKSTPYYVHVTVENSGTGDVSRTPVPIYAVDERNALIQASSFNNDFKRCPSQALPAGFTHGKTLGTCLVYIVPAGDTLVMMSYRPLQAFEPITWKGTIAPPASTSSKKSPPRDKKKG